MRVLFLTHRLPYAPNRGDRARAYNLLKALRHRAKVDLVSLVHSEEEAGHGEEIRDQVDSLEMCRVPFVWNRIKGAAMLGTTRTLTHLLLDSPEVKPAVSRTIGRAKPDVVLVYCSSMGRFALESPLAGIPFVVDMVDVDSVKWHDLASRARPPFNWIYARETRLLGRFEAELAFRAHATTVVTRREARALTRLAPNARVEVSPLGIDMARLHPTGPPIDSQDVVFCGVMNYTPNEDAAVWVNRYVWPAVRARQPHARLLLVGSEPSARVKALANKAAGVEVTGTVNDVRPYLWNAAVSIAPLLTARGTQSKVLEAVACGLPTVITEVVADGLPEEVLPACSVAGTPEAFADAIVALLETPPAARRAQAGRAASASLSWDRSLEPLIALLEEAVRESRT